MRLGGEWRLDPSVTFLNHGSFGSTPSRVLEAQAAWRERLERGPIRFLSRELEGHLDRARATIGAFLNADPDGLVFVPNATTGINTVLQTLDLRSGDELLANDHEYNATLNALERVASGAGGRVVLARIPFPVVDPGDVVDAILGAAGPRTRLALISHVTSPTSLVMPVGEVVRELHERGIDTLVDAAHAPGMVPIDVDGLGAAYWTGNGHKWLCGPKSSAVLWVETDRRDRVRPLVTSHGANDPRVDRSRYRLQFDWTGTADPTPFLALADAIGLVGDMDPGGWPAIMAAGHDLVLRGAGIVGEAIGAELPAPESMIGAMASLPVAGLRTDDAAKALQQALVDDSIEVPVDGWPVRAARAGAADPREVLLRISAAPYNEPADYERLAAALDRLTSAPRRSPVS